MWRLEPRFYQHTCWILSWPHAWNKFNGLRPPQVPSRAVDSEEDPRGSDPWILSHSNFRSGPLILSLKGWAFEFFIFILLEAWYLFLKRGFSLSLSFNLHLWLAREKCQPWLKKAPAKLASITGAWSLFCWAVLTCLSNSTLKASLLTLKPYGFCFLTSRYWNWPKQKRLPNPVLRPSGAKVGGNQEQIKSMTPTLIDEPFRKTGIKQRCTKIIFLGELWHVSLALAPRKPVNIILKSSFVELSHQGQILKLIQNTSYHILATNISPGPPSAPG